MLLDFILIFTIVFLVICGYRKGFSQMLISFGVLVFSLFIVMIIYEKLGDLIIRSKYGQNLIEHINTSMNEHISAKYNSFAMNIPFLEGTMESFSGGVNKLTLAFSRRTLEILLSIPLFIVSYFMVRVIVVLLRKFFLKVSSVPVISGVDAILGSICGGFAGLVIVFAFYYIVSYVQFLPAFDYLPNQYNSSLIVMLINDFI